MVLSNQKKYWLCSTFGWLCKIGSKCSIRVKIDRHTSMSIYKLKWWVAAEECVILSGLLGWLIKFLLSPRDAGMSSYKKIAVSGKSSKTEMVVHARENVWEIVTNIRHLVLVESKLGSTFCIARRCSAGNLSTFPWFNLSGDKWHRSHNKDGRIYIMSERDPRTIASSQSWACGDHSCNSYHNIHPPIGTC